MRYIIKLLRRINITSKIKNLSGQKFGRLTVLYELHNHHKQGAWWLCVCECGNLKELKGTALRGGDYKSCGCFIRELASNRFKKHGKSNTRLFNIWQAMKERCYKNHNKAYPNYGGRGIAVCSEWRDDFQAFYDWSMVNGYKEGLTIDRIDNNGNYEPNNCRWVDYKTQSRNRRSLKYYTINGVTHCLSEWCEIYNINYKCVWKRLKRGWNIIKALELEKLR